MITNETLYKTYVNAQKGNLDKPAIYTREGRMITHGELLDEIDKVAEGLLSYKTDSNLRIGVISSTSYQEGIILLAANKIGAVSKFVDFTKNIMEIGESIAESSINILAIGSEFLPLEQFVNPSGVPVIVLDEVQLTSPHHITYRQLCEKGNGHFISPADYVDGACAVIVNSSGTTGTPKPIQLSDRALNAAVMKHVASDLPLAESNIMLKIIPSHIGMGLISTVYTCLITGDPIVYIPANGPEESMRGVLNAIATFPLFIKENGMKASTKLLLFAAPMYYRTLYQFLARIEDLSYVGCMLAGGSAMSKDELDIFDAAFAAKGCTVPVVVGYGQNEMAGGVTMNEIHANKPGSAGKPMAHTMLKIVDMISGDPVPANTIGKILERSDSLFIGYENMPERTAASFITDENGDVWFDTTDVGYLDEDGFLFITGRASRIIIRFDQKASLDKMESKIRMSKYVKEVGVISQSNVPYDMAIAFAVLNDEYTEKDISPEMIINDVQSGHNYLTDLEKIDKLIIVESLPYLSSGKINYRALAKEAAESL